MRAHPTEKKPASESGQIIVLLALVFVALLGFASLAVDGGLLFVDRRAAQNASDSAAMAGAARLARSMDEWAVSYTNLDCSSTHMKAAIAAAYLSAITQAARSGYFIDADVSDGDGVTVSCDTDRFMGITYKYLDVQVMITVRTKSYFARFVYPDPLKNTVRAVARVTPRAPLAFGYAVVSLDETLDVGMEMDGGGQGHVRVNRSGIFSNSALVVNGGVNIFADGDIEYVTYYEKNGSAGSVYPPPVKVPVMLLKPTIPPPDCDSLPSRGSHAGSGTLSTGRYSSITVSTGETLTLNPGLYCLYGDFKANGGTVSGDGVTLYLASGGFSATGNTQITLKAPTSDSEPAMKGMVIYMAERNTAGIKLLGSSDSMFQGTVYAPHAYIDLGGGGSQLSSVRSQLVARGVKIHGNVVLEITYDQSENYSRRAVIDMVR